MIISAFAGSGKSYATKQLENAIDLESSDYLDKENDRKGDIHDKFH